jgi:hypothetical protein
MLKNEFEQKEHRIISFVTERLIENISFDHLLQLYSNGFSDICALVRTHVLRSTETQRCP